MCFCLAFVEYLDMWKDDMGGCTRVGNGFFLAKCDIDACGGLESIVIVIKI